jgi:neutral ceramidase
MSTVLRVGAATADITPPVGCALGGYGSRTGVSVRLHTPLRAQVLVVDDGLRPVAIAACDLLFATFDLTRLVREAVSAALGWQADQVMVTASHTHSGPAALTLAQDRAYVEQVAARIAGAIAEAACDARPASLRYVETTVTSISQNRRHPDGPIETTARILAATAGRDPITTVVSYACHATVLEGDNLDISPDFPGTTVALVADAVGGRAMYLQGCCGDINPVWSSHDHAEAARIGSIVGLAAARAVHESVPLGHGQWVRNLSWSEDCPADIDRADLVTPGPIASASVQVALPPRELMPDGVGAELRRVTAALEEPGADRRQLMPHREALAMEALYSRRVYPYALRDGRAAQRPDSVEVQALRIGPDLAVVGIPGEPFIQIAADIRQRAGIRHLLVAGYANEAIGYVPVAEEFPRRGYEVGCARYGPGAAALLADGAMRALQAAAAVQTVG